MPCKSHNAHLNTLESAQTHHSATQNKKYVLESIGVVCDVGWWVLDNYEAGGEETANSMFQHSSKMRKD